MLQDIQTQFSGSIGADGTRYGQAISATAISANVLDLRQSDVPAIVEEGSTLVWLVVQVLTAAAGGDAAKTLTITIESDSTADLATSPTVHWSSPAITGATLIAGYVAVRTPLASGDYERYLGLRYTLSDTFTSFTLLACLTPTPPRNVIHPSGFTVN